MFGRVSLCMYVCMYVWIYVCICGQKRAVWGLTTWKSPISVIYCLLVKFNGQKRGLLCQAICSGKEIWNHSINGTKKVLENCITVSHTLSTCMHSAQRRYDTRTSPYLNYNCNLLHCIASHIVIKVRWGTCVVPPLHSTYAMLMNAECQHTTAAVQTYNIATVAVCTDSA